MQIQAKTGLTGPNQILKYFCRLCVRSCLIQASLFYCLLISEESAFSAQVLFPCSTFDISGKKGYPQLYFTYKHHILGTSVHYFAMSPVRSITEHGVSLLGTLKNIIPTPFIHPTKKQKTKIRCLCE